MGTDTNKYGSFFKKAGGQEGKTCRYSLRLDTYGCGCSHDCKYCYAKSILSFRNMWNASRPKSADLQEIAKTINKMDPNNIVRLGGMTDCLQDCERYEKLTYKTILMLNERRISYIIVTKSDLIASDPYIDILDKDLAHIQISVTSTSDDISKKIEKAPVYSRRVAAIEKLAATGFDVQIRLSPYINEYINTDAINSIKCDKILVEFLRVNHWIRQWLDIDYSEYTHYENNYYHLPLSVKIEMLKKINGFKSISVCEDCKEHFEYWRTHVNPNYYDCCNLRITL